MKPLKNGHLYYGTMEFPDALFHGIGRVLGGGEAFVDLEFSRSVIEQDEVRKGPANITAQPVIPLRHEDLLTQHLERKGESCFEKRWS